MFPTLCSISIVYSYCVLNIIHFPWSLPVFIRTPRRSGMGEEEGERNMIFTTHNGNIFKNTFERYVFLRPKRSVSSQKIRARKLNFRFHLFFSWSIRTTSKRAYYDLTTNDAEGKKEGRRGKEKKALLKWENDFLKFAHLVLKFMVECIAYFIVLHPSRNFPIS